MSLDDKIRSFNPNDPGQSDGNLFGLPFTPEEARVVVLPVPWDVTTSYRPGTHAGPEAVLRASRQIDLHDPVLPGAWKLGVAMEPVPADLAERNAVLRTEAERIIASLENGNSPESDPGLAGALDAVNRGCRDMLDRVREAAGRHLDAGRRVVLLGGDHSTSLGLIEALAARHDGFGILQVDAHADLREAYEGFTWSHASVIFNALKLPQVQRLVQVGLRDVCEEEIRVIEGSDGRVRAHFDRDLKHAVYRGRPLAEVHREIIEQLPREVYVSLDIDGLDPSLCPHTGTPVPGGLGFEECLHLLETLVDGGRRIVGLDVNEVCPGPDDEWDANVGARLLFRAINRMAASDPALSGGRS